jgi:hypothetical protein
LHISPTLEGFRAALRRPLLTLAEIAWRWTVGAVAGALFLFAFVEFLDTLPVTRADAALLRTRQPLFVGRAIAHILRGSLNRAVVAALLAVLALSLLWIIAASIGRVATVRGLLEHFREKVAVADSSGVPDRSQSFQALIGLQFFRVASVLAALLALAGAGILAGFASSEAKPQPGLVVILFLPLAGLVGAAWSGLNWLLSVAGIFAIRDREDSLGALSAAATFVRERLAAVAAVSTWTGLAHLVAFSIAGSAMSVPLAFAPLAPKRLILAIVVLVTLAYLAVVDWLYIARLAGYISIVEMPEALASSPALPLPPLAAQLAPIPAQTAIDRDEPILSDIPTFTPAM